MNFTEFERMFKQQNNNWWYLSRTQNVKKLIKGKNLKILDIASATGNSFFSFAEFGIIYGIDISKEGVKYCKRVGADRITLGDGTNLPYKNKSFDTVLALDALEHMKLDEKCLQEINRVLKSGGQFICTVPAFMMLWGAHDVAYHHVRRYKIDELKEKFYKTGFIVEYATYWSFFIFPFVLFFRKLRKDSTKSDFYINLPQLSEKILIYLQCLESNLIKRGYKFPFGVSILSVAKKPYFNGDKVSVIIPVFNEERTISSVVKLTEWVMKENKLNGEIIIIDDKSEDISLSIIKKLERLYNNIKVIENAENIGKTNSIKKAVADANGDIIITIDADMQYEPIDIMKLLYQFDGDNIGIVTGYRKNRKDSIKRKLYSYFFNKFNSLLFGIGVKDINCGLKAYKRDVFDEINIGDSKWFFDVEALAKAKNKGYNIKEVEVSHKDRVCGKSKIYLPLLIYETIVNSIKLRIELWKNKQ